jgi:hypothetical protein
MKAPAESEASIQRGIVDYVQAVAPQCLIFAVPNASRRTKGGRASNGVAGLTAGIPDLCIIAPGGVAYFMEVKTPKGRLSDAQFTILNRLTGLHSEWQIVHSIDDARYALKCWNILTREAA